MLDIYCSGQFVLIEFVVQGDDAFILWDQYPPHSCTSFVPILWDHSWYRVTRVCHAPVSGTNVLFGATIIFFSGVAEWCVNISSTTDHIYVYIFVFLFTIIVNDLFFFIGAEEGVMGWGFT